MYFNPTSRKFSQIRTMWYSSSMSPLLHRVHVPCAYGIFALRHLALSTRYLWLLSLNFVKFTLKFCFISQLIYLSQQTASVAILDVTEAFLNNKYFTTCCNVWSLYNTIFSRILNFIYCLNMHVT